LDLKHILLKKLDSLLNPQFDKKIIWALLTFGFLLIGYQNLINFITSFEFKYKGLFLKLSIENETDIFLKIVGIIFVLIACLFYYLVFIKNRDNTKYKTLKEASCTIKKLLDENKRIFKTQGPNSSTTSVDNLRNTAQLSVWNETKSEKIVPNNEKIYSILAKIETYKESEISLVEDMKNHIEAFKNHVQYADVDYSEHQFPIKFSILITKYCNNGLLANKYFEKYTSWINEYIVSNQIEYIQDKYIFGSVLYDKKPHDIDVLLFVNTSSSTELFSTSELLKQMEKKFKADFDKSLHLTVFSLREEERFDDFKNRLLDTKEF
jgi:predicted nucleotidyltransferase